LSPWSRFDEDEKRFARDVKASTLIITNYHWPSFLYPETGDNPNDINEVFSVAPS
jgi:hypothetical protein